MQLASIDFIRNLPPVSLQPDQTSFFVLINFLFVFAYYYLVWKKTRVSQKRILLDTSAEPIPEFSPGATRYLKLMRFDIKTMTVALINLAIKGYICFEINLLSTKLIPKKNIAHPDELPLEERIIIEDLCNPHDFFGMKKAKDVKFIKKNFKKTLVAQFKNKYFTTHRIYTVLGVLLSLPAFWLVFYMQNSNWEMMLTRTFLILLCVLFIHSIIQLFEGLDWVFQRISVATMLRFTAGLVLIFIFLLVIIPSLIHLTKGQISIYTIPSFVGILLLNFIFYYLLPSPTQQGILPQIKIQQLQDFLAKQRGIKDAETFEKNLPYAIAFNLEKTWCQSMDDRYQPRWVTGTSKIPISRLIGVITNSLSPGTKGRKPSLKIEKL